jgi:xanthine dehydrogenase accessory factor
MHETTEWTLWKYVLDTLKAGGSAAFIAVVAHEKGSPGKTGFKMAFTADKQSIGTIGGGIMEFSLKEQYAGLLRNGKTFCDVRTLVHALETRRGEPSGLTCSGSQTICAVSLHERDIPAVASILDALSDHLPAIMGLTPNGLTCTAGWQAAHSAFEQLSAFGWTYTENVGPEYTMYIIGGGHVGAALSRIAARLDFYVVVYDDREGLPMVSEGISAHKKITAPYTELASHIVEPQKSFAAIVTADYTTDSVAVKQLLPMRLPYLGIMGVEAKIARIKNSLSPEEQLEFEHQHIYAPIGMRIDSGTADEIAVSIAAEVITVRNALEK